VLPRPVYYELVRDAAKELGPEFAQIWFATTYMGDGITPIETWERALQMGIPFTKSKSSPDFDT